MNRRTEDRGLLSRLPDDPTYWDGLTDRIVEASAPDLVAFAAANDPLSWATPRVSGALSLLAAAAVAAAIWVLPPVAAPASRAPLPAGAERTRVDPLGLAPDDPLVAPLVGAEAPPAMEIIWAGVPREGR